MDMDYGKLAELIFPHITRTVDDLEARFPERVLPDGALATRLAPSPTGYMHIGGLYAALISRKLAKQTGGVFYLRIEDTDKKRELEGGVDEILRSLADFGIEFDEGPFPGGEKAYGPYMQSLRGEIYQICVKELMRRGYAYPCFCTAEELDALRRSQEEKKDDVGYYGEYARCRNLSLEEVEEKVSAGLPYVVRLRSPGSAGGRVTYRDPVRGFIEMPENRMDVVLLKSDGIPTYHFAHVVDDHFMRTGLVVRGDEWLTSYPVHEQLFRLCGFALPDYVHIAPIMKMDGTARRKLSKRKDPEAAVGFFLEQGFPPESVREYLLTIANSNYEEWHSANPELSEDDFTLSLDKMPVSGALFDMVKLTDVSREVIAAFSIEECYERILAWSSRYDADLYAFASGRKETFLETIGLWKMSGRKVRKDVAKWSDLMRMFDYLYMPQDKFEASVSYELDGRFPPEQLREAVEKYKQDLFLDSDDWFGRMKEMGARLGYCPDMKEYKRHPQDYKGSIADLCGIVRVAVTGHKNSPDLYTIMKVLGEDVVRRRLDLFLENADGGGIR